MAARSCRRASRSPTSRSSKRRREHGDRRSCRTPSALALPFAPGAFDGAYLLHVGMSIEDKLALFADARRS
jgi:hypothetical protein